jgi:hypothetical protein
MNKYTRIVVVIVFILGLTGAVKAQAEEGVIAKMPFPFVVGSQALPAGTYTVRSLTLDKSGVLIMTSKEHSTSILFLPHMNKRSATYKPELSFQQIGGQYFLSTIRTSLVDYEFAVPQSGVNETATISSDAVHASGSHGGK